jgi:hypothetical protein
MENLDKIILEMTRETQELTVEWVFRAIEKLENYMKLSMKELKQSHLKDFQTTEELEFGLVPLLEKKLLKMKLVLMFIMLVLILFKEVRIETENLRELSIVLRKILKLKEQVLKIKL